MTISLTFRTQLRITAGHSRPSTWRIIVFQNFSAKRSTSRNFTAERSGSRNFSAARSDFQNFLAERNGFLRFPVENRSASTSEIKATVFWSNCEGDTGVTTDILCKQLPTEGVSLAPVSPVHFIVRNIAYIHKYIYIYIWCLFIFSATGCQYRKNIMLIKKSCCYLYARYNLGINVHLYPTLCSSGRVKIMLSNFKWFTRLLNRRNNVKKSKDVQITQKKMHCFGMTSNVRSMKWRHTNRRTI